MSVSQDNQSIYTSAPELDQDREKLIETWLKDLKPKISLDVGCAGGCLSKLLADEVEKWGIDFEKNPNLPENFNFIAADIANTWNVPDNYFDLLFAGEIIEHVLDTDLFLSSSFRALKSGGVLILTTPNLSSFANLKYWLRTDNYMWVDSSTNQFGHVRYLSPKRMRDALTKTGYTNIKLSTVSGIETLGFFPPLLLFVRNLFPLRGNRLCAFARKP